MAGAGVGAIVIHCEKKDFGSTLVLPAAMVHLPSLTTIF
jgi:hypothetical protein